jgi:hypothetical protein
MRTHVGSKQVSTAHVRWYPEGLRRLTSELLWWVPPDTKLRVSALILHERCEKTMPTGRVLSVETTGPYIKGKRTEKEGSAVLGCMSPGAAWLPARFL